MFSIENNKFRISFFALALTMMFMSGCATMSRQRVDEETAKVKKAAIVAFIVKAPASRKIGMSLNSGSVGGMVGGSSFYQKAEQADQMLGDFHATMEKQAKWSIQPLANTVRDSIYAHRTKQIMSAVKVTKLPPAGENWYLVDSLMVPSGIETYDRNTRNQLLTALDVDALISVEVKVENKGSFLGLGSHYPQSSMRMQVWKRDRDEPIWIEWIEGDKSKTSTGITAFMDEAEMLKLARESAQTAFSKIGTEIK